MIALNQASIEAIAQRTAQLLRVSSTQQPAKHVLTLKEAAAYAGKPGIGAFYRWARRWGVRPCAYGRYSRSHISRAMEREAMHILPKKPIYGGAVTTERKGTHATAAAGEIKKCRKALVPHTPADQQPSPQQSVGERSPRAPSLS